MFVSVTRAQAPPDRIDDGARMIQEELIPSLRAMNGFKGGYWLANRQTGSALAVVLWESEDALRAGTPVAEQSGTQAARTVGATIEGTEVYEVIAQS